MRVHGHLVEVDWDGAVLHARGTNVDSRALLDSGTEDGRLELSVADIDLVAFVEAPRRVGGVLIVVGTNGTEHRMHFRRPSREDFERLSQELDTAVADARAQRAVVVDLTESPATSTDGSVTHVARARSRKTPPVNASARPRAAAPTS